MADYSKRPEVTVETMGKVHNPTETKVKEEGSSRRNITRKKTDAPSGGGGGAGSYGGRNKKQGGAGKGRWDPLDGSDGPDAAPALDERDPLYDETEAGGGYVLTAAAAGPGGARANGGDGPGSASASASGGAGAGAGASAARAVADDGPTGYDEVARRAVYGPMLTLPEFKIRVSDAVREYYDAADADEVVRGIEEMRCRPFHPEVVKRAVGLSLDKGPRERELTSRLLTCLHPTPLSDGDMEAGFTLLLDSLDDLVIDIPDARAMVGSFLARAVVDEVLPPAYLSGRNNSHPGDEVVERAVGLLSREHCNARLEHVWGPGDGRPVAELKTVMDQLLEEYLLSRELDEAARCVREMDAPHFHHELVKRGARIAMEKDGLDHRGVVGDGAGAADADAAAAAAAAAASSSSSSSSSSSLDAMAALFSFLVKNAIVSEYQVAKGIGRLRRLLPDLKLDVPAAPAMLDEFEEMAREGGCLPAKLALVSDDGAAGGGGGDDGKGGRGGTELN